MTVIAVALRIGTTVDRRVAGVLLQQPADDTNALGHGKQVGATSRGQRRRRVAQSEPTFDALADPPLPGRPPMVGAEGLEPPTLSL